MTTRVPLVCTPEALHDAMRAVAFYAVEHHLAHDHQADSNDVTRRYEQAANAVAALFRPAEEPDPLGFSPERLAQGEADVAAGRVVELGDALQRIRDNPPSAGDRPGNPMPASAPVAPPPAEERADLPASEESSWAPVLVESRTPETESVMIHHAHRGQACVACELAALRSELSASQREVEKARDDGYERALETAYLHLMRGLTDFPSGSAPTQVLLSCLETLHNLSGRDLHAVAAGHLEASRRLSAPSGENRSDG